MSKRALYIKPQYQLRKHLGDYWTLTSEVSHEVLDHATAEFLERLAHGLDLADVVEIDMPVLSRVNDLGYVEIRDLDTALTVSAKPFWELVGYKWQAMTAQKNYLSYSITADVGCHESAQSITELIKNMVGEPTQSGKVNLFITDSAKKIHATSVPTLVIIINRLLVSVGPMVYPWTSQETIDELQGGLSYMAIVGYTLTPDLVAMQNAWIAASVIKTLSNVDLSFIGKRITFNLVTYNLASTV